MQLVILLTEYFGVFLHNRLSGACASFSPTYPTRGTITARAFSFITGVICTASSAPPPYARCGVAPTPTPALRATSTP